MKKKKEHFQVRSLQKKLQNSKHKLHRELMEHIYKYVNSGDLEVEKINKEYGVECGSAVEEKSISKCCSVFRKSERRQCNI